MMSTLPQDWDPAPETNPVRPPRTVGEAIVVASEYPTEANLRGLAGLVVKQTLVAHGGCSSEAERGVFSLLSTLVQTGDLKWGANR